MMLGVIGLVVVGCSTQSDQPPVPDVAMSEASKSSMEVLQRGRAVYVSECARCHEAMMPQDVSEDEWHVILPGMAWNSGISSADEEAVEAYIRAVKAQ
ncbi:c-type cytochrome [Haloferula sp.]